MDRKSAKDAIERKFRKTPIFRELFNLYLTSKADLTPKYTITEITEKLREKFGSDPKYEKLNVSTVKRWIDKCDLAAEKQRLVLLSNMEEPKEEVKGKNKEAKEKIEEGIIEEKLEMITDKKIKDLKERYNSLESVFKQSQYLLNILLKEKIKKLTEFLKDEHTAVETGQFLREMGLYERDLIVVLSKSFECLDKFNTNDKDDSKKTVETFFEMFNNSFGKI